MKRLALFLVVLLLAISPSWGQLSGFSKYKEITISHANVDADLTNFPVYIPIIGDTDIGAICQSDGDDVQFSNAGNTATLTFERLPGFAVAAGAASGDFYVLVPTVAGSSDTVIRCYYGDADATSASSAANTFATGNNWVAVWHLEESGSGYLDATGNNNDSVSQDAPTRVTGLVGGYAQEFVAANHNWIKVADSASLDVTTTFSGQALVKRTSDAEAPFVNKVNSFTWTVTAAGKNQIVLRSDPATDYISTTGSDDTNQHYFGITVDSSYVHHYVDSTADSDQSQTNNAVANSSALFLGAYDEYESLDSNIIIDEIRIYAGALSDAWHKFTYYNWQEGHAAGNELTWGAETSPSGFVPIAIIIN